jgi:hypothetical protein
MKAMKTLEPMVALQTKSLKKVPKIQGKSKREMMVKLLMNLSWKKTNLSHHPQNERRLTSKEE